MKNNVGKFDAYIRLFIGLVLVLLSLIYSWYFIPLAALMFFTAYRKTCGLYTIFGISSCKFKEEN